MNCSGHAEFAQLSLTGERRNFLENVNFGNCICRRKLRLWNAISDFCAVTSCAYGGLHAGLQKCCLDTKTSGGHLSLQSVTSPGCGLGVTSIWSSTPLQKPRAPTTGPALRTNGQNALIVSPQPFGTKPCSPPCRSRGGPPAKRGYGRCAMAPTCCPTGWHCSAAQRHTLQLGLWFTWSLATCSPWGSCGAHAACCVASLTGFAGTASAASNCPPRAVCLTESGPSAVQFGTCPDAADAALHHANLGGLQPAACAEGPGNMTAPLLFSTMSPLSPRGRFSFSNARKSTSALGPSRGWDWSRLSSTWRLVRNPPTSPGCWPSGQAMSATLSLPLALTSSSGECCSCGDACDALVTSYSTALVPVASPARAASCWRGARDGVVACSFLLTCRLLCEACADLVAAALKISQNISYLVPQQAPTSTCICVKWLIPYLDSTHSPADTGHRKVYSPILAAPALD